MTSGFEAHRRALLELGKSPYSSKRRITRARQALHGFAFSKNISLKTDAGRSFRLRHSSRITTNLVVYSFHVWPAMSWDGRLRFSVPFWATSFNGAVRHLRRTRHRLRRCCPALPCRFDRAISNSAWAEFRTGVPHRQVVSTRISTSRSVQSGTPTAAVCTKFHRNRF